MMGNVGMGSKAGSVSMTGRNMGGTSSVHGLNVNDDVRPRAIKPLDYNIGAVAEAMKLSEVIKRTAGPTALTDNTRRTKGRVKDGEQTAEKLRAAKSGNSGCQIRQLARSKG